MLAQTVASICILKYIVWAWSDYIYTQLEVSTQNPHKSECMRKCSVLGWGFVSILLYFLIHGFIHVLSSYQMTSWIICKLYTVFWIAIGCDHYYEFKVCGIVKLHREEQQPTSLSPHVYCYLQACWAPHPNYS